MSTPATHPVEEAMESGFARARRRELGRSLIALPLFLVLAIPVFWLYRLSAFPLLAEVFSEQVGLLVLIVFGGLWAIARGVVEVWFLSRDDKRRGAPLTLERPEPYHLRQKPDEETLDRIRSFGAERPPWE